MPRGPFQESRFIVDRVTACLLVVTGTGWESVFLPHLMTVLRHRPEGVAPSAVLYFVLGALQGLFWLLGGLGGVFSVPLVARRLLGLGAFCSVVALGVLLWQGWTRSGSGPSLLWELLHFATAALLVFLAWRLGDREGA